MGKSGSGKTHIVAYFTYPVDIYVLKVNNRSTRTRCEICSKLTIKTPERRNGKAQFTHSFGRITPCSSASIVNFEQVIAHYAVLVRVKILI